MRTQTMVIPGRMPGQNEVVAMAKIHWSAYAKEKERLTEQVRLLAKSARMETIAKPALLCFRWVEKDRRRDMDNLRAACKFIIDGLVEAGVLPTDGWKWITGFEDRFEVDKKNPRIEVTIVEEDEE